MELEKIQSRIRKLKAMGEMIGPEADNAKRIIQTLIEKYNLNPDEVLEPRKNMRFKVHRLKKYAILLSGFCKIPVYVLRGFPDYISIDADPDEYKMFYELLDDIKHQFNTNEKRLQKEARDELTKSYGPFYEDKYFKKQINTWKNDALRSYMMGYMATNFPSDHKLCTACNKGTIVDMVCNSCGTKYKSSKYRQYGLNQDQYNKGMNTSTKSIGMDKKRIGA